MGEQVVDVGLAVGNRDDFPPGRQGGFGGLERLDPASRLLLGRGLGAMGRPLPQPRWLADPSPLVNEPAGDPTDERLEEELIDLKLYEYCRVALRRRDEDA